MRTTPAVIIFDVNETLSDMGAMGGSFEREGLPPVLARAWFAELLRDGFALTSTGKNPAFADLAADGLRRLIAEHSSHPDPDRQVERILGVFKKLEMHGDAAPGIRGLGRLAQLVTLSNGAPSVADSLLSRAGVRDQFSQLLSVEDALLWKPAREAYDYAAQTLDRPVEQLMLVAVHPWDIQGAHSAGLRTAWINRRGSAYPSYFAAPDIEAADLVELAEKLQQTS
ncbi:haloacid dehalogenase type II [Nesterenkonia lutea]|uniref:2-haloacid dehalogenase n=1 Tax=Nesterenkonia lutea TaxID=272919 RepID=A0ABR9JBA6_9MICC|nr:haloacid dehalogenase type II [Nesterenkonia lutea]MBE1523210.1 2-haloacid dehalogenase [Nesterenkonia lutea]